MANHALHTSVTFVMNNHVLFFHNWLLWRQWWCYTRLCQVKWPGWKANDLPADLAVVGQCQVCNLKKKMQKMSQSHLRIFSDQIPLCIFKVSFEMTVDNWSIYHALNEDQENMPYPHSQTPAAITVTLDRFLWSHLPDATGKLSLQVTPTTFSTFPADHEFLAGCYLFTVSNSGLLFSHGATTGFPNFHFHFSIKWLQFYRASYAKCSLGSRDSVRPSVCLSDRHMRALWLIQRTDRRYFYTTRKGNHSSLLMPKISAKLQRCHPQWGCQWEVG